MASLLALLAACGGGAGNPTYSIGAQVSGLAGSGLTLQLSTGGTLSVTANGVSTFPMRLPSHTAYELSVKTQPSTPQQLCSVTHGSGVIAASNVTVAITCQTVKHSVNVSVAGLAGAGFVLQLNGAHNLPIGVNGTSSFATAIDSGASYAVTVATEPANPTQSCSIKNGSGTIGNANVSIAVACVTTGPTVTTLYSFGTAGPTDATSPQALVQGHDGNLYGVSSGGGSYSSGTLFRITLSGQEVLIFSFGAAGCANLTSPVSPCSPQNLIVGNNGNFYGKTAGVGGTPLVGAVWGIAPNGVEFLEYDFGFNDGGDQAAQGGVIQASDGLLYGTAYGAPYGNPPGSGESVFAAADAYGSVFGFVGDGFGPANCYPDCPAGSAVEASLVQTRDGYLYGTAAAGGAFGNGTVFRTSPGTSQVIPVVAIYSFGAQSGDPLNPRFSLVEGADGNLYGTSSLGGTPSTPCPQGCGTVFKVTPAGTETVLHSFGGSGTDGQNPSGSLLLGSDGNFYGVTSSGGSNTNCKVATGCGTVYRITPSGVETVLYTFGTTVSDGANPSGALIEASDGHLYGTSVEGGTANMGTVFRLDLAGN